MADWVRIGLIAVWALAGLALVRKREVRPLGTLILVGAAIGAVSVAFGAPIGCFILMALSAHALLALPDGRLGTRARQVAVSIGYAAALVAGLVVWSVDGELTVPIGATAWCVAIVLALPAAHQRYLTATGAARQRMQWLGSGAALAGEVTVIVGGLWLLLEWPNHAGAIAAAATALIPVAAIASTMPRIAGRVDRVLVHTVSAVGLTVVLLGVYVVVVLGFGRPPNDDERTLLGLSMVAAAIGAVVYLPARNRLADTANRLVYGERRAPDEVIRTFGQRLTRAVPMDELLLQLAESLRKTMALRSAEIWTGSGEVLERAASVPDRGAGTLTVGPRERPVVARAGVSGAAWASVWMPAVLDGHESARLRIAPACHSGELLGLIVVEGGATTDEFTETDDQMLAELARQVGLALHNVELDSALQASLDEVRRQADELRASRARVVASGDAERRRIERNLHDGAQQHLVALAVNVRLTRDLVTEDPEAAVEMLDVLAGTVKDTIQELRDLAHGIYPPLLRDRGVVEALGAAAARSPLPVSVVADGVGRHAPEVEAAAYFCCLEALQNAAKHAPGAHVAVRVWEESGGLLFTVADDGPGFDPAIDVASKGHGFINMADRLGAIGGTVHWESTPGNGVTVRGSIPLGNEADGAGVVRPHPSE
jgi:signal transduction histidine kinase